MLTCSKPRSLNRRRAVSESNWRVRCFFRSLNPSSPAIARSVTVGIELHDFSCITKLCSAITFAMTNAATRHAEPVRHDESQQPAEAPVLTREILTLAAVVVLGAIMTVLDATIVNVAL